MNNTLRLVASSLVLSLASLGPAVGADYLLYAPEKSDGKAPSGPNEGVLVKSITIQRGDTLYSLSRKYSGKGTYYPQILLFNEIVNPDMIYAGNKIMVPLPAGEGKVEELRRKSEPAVKGDKGTKTTATAKERGKVSRGKQAAPAAVREKAPKGPTPLAQTPPGAPKVSTDVKAATGSPAPKPAAPAAAPRKSEENEQTLFERGVSAYKSGHYQQSLDSFDSFLSRYPGSPLVPDATLYRADALLKLAGQ
ncbi:MAG: LysM peptidoglycan-binding domain-containing protein [Desulfuromonadales bacterium]|nr:MAG: LysM peptidoglycan-binding domain-containing protein [Desulfuromonadales bacterium]